MRLSTDLACELLRGRPFPVPGLKVTTAKHRGLIVHTTHISTRAAATAIGKPVGTYINIATTTTRPPQILTNILAQELGAILPNTEKILIVGLGNAHFIADSLGPRVLSYIETSGQCLTFQPSVFGVTGINSVDAIRAITNLVHPTVVIVIDSLVSLEPERIGTNYQLCTSGITPGSGLGRDNHKIDQKLLGVPVIAIGVPVCTVMTAHHRTYHLVPKDIDAVINQCALTIATAINTVAQHSSPGATKH